VRAAYTSALDALGLAYNVWDTGNSDDEPDAATLGSYEMVIWFTGHEFGGFAGPGTAGETALGSWLAGGGCLLMSSQDYLLDRGVTSFAGTFLGVAAHTDNTQQTTVAGTGAFDWVGPYTLAYPFANASDSVLPTASADTSFTGDFGGAGLDKDAGAWATVFLAFPLEAAPTPGNRVAVLASVLDFCAGGAVIFRDGVESGDTDRWSSAMAALRRAGAGDDFVASAARKGARSSGFSGDGGRPSSRPPRRPAP
jgi:hypothetical protein